MEEIFVLWQPILIPLNPEKINLICLLTSLSTLAPINSIELPIFLLWRLNIKATIISWQLKFCLTDYTTPPEDLDSQEDKWSKAWILSIEIENPTENDLVLKHESIFLKGGSISINQISEVDKASTYLIITDFYSEEDRAEYLELVSELIPASSVEMMMAKISGINLSVFQLRLLINAEYSGIITRIEQLCLQHGGFTNFVERLDAAEEIYNPKGIE